MSKPQLWQPKTWAFLKEIQDTGVLGKYDKAFYVAGTVMYGVTLAFYVLLAMWVDDEFTENSPGHSENTTGRQVKLLYVVVGLHVAIGLAVLYDAIHEAGKNILLQTFIIGAGTFNTIYLTIPLSYGLSHRDSDESLYFTYALCSFASACISNAMMLALLFAMFHAKTVNTLSAPTGKKLKSLVF